MAETKPHFLSFCVDPLGQTHGVSKAPGQRVILFNFVCESVCWHGDRAQTGPGEVNATPGELWMGPGGSLAPPDFFVIVFYRHDLTRKPLWSLPLSKHQSDERWRVRVTRIAQGLFLTGKKESRTVKAGDETGDPFKHPGRLIEVTRIVGGDRRGGRRSDGVSRSDRVSYGRRCGPLGALGRRPAGHRSDADSRMLTKTLKLQRGRKIPPRRRKLPRPKKSRRSKSGRSGLSRNRRLPIPRESGRSRLGR